jgi:hypothetical protein
MLGDEADAAGPPKELPTAVAQVPDAVPAVPPPSKTIVETAVGDVVPALDIPVPTDVPMIETLAPDVVPAVAVPVAERVGGLPKDTCGSEPPIPEHCVTVPIVDVPIIGLTPGVLSSVEPSGMPVGATAEPGSMPRGDVGVRPGTGLAVPPICANAGLNAKSAANPAVMSVPRMTLTPSPKMATRVEIYALRRRSSGQELFAVGWNCANESHVSNVPAKTRPFPGTPDS